MKILVNAHFGHWNNRPFKKNKTENPGNIMENEKYNLKL